MKYLLTTVLLFSFSQANAVTYISGNELLKYCDEYISKSTTFNGGLCGGYVVGVVDIAATFEAWGKMTQQFCIPNGVTTDQLVQITYKALKEELESLHLTAASLVIIALTKAFPCVNNPVDTVIYPRIVPDLQSQPLHAHTREVLLRSNLTSYYLLPTSYSQASYFHLPFFLTTYFHLPT